MPNANQTNSDYLIQIIDKYLFSASDSRNMTRFLQYYKSEIFQWVCKRHDVIFKYILSKLGLEFVKCVNLLAHVIEFASSEKSLRKSLGPKLVACLYENWHLFSLKSGAETDTSDNVDRKLVLINLLTKSLLIESFKVFI